MLFIGDYRVETFTPDRLRLDGGAMFGAIPKTLWSKRIAADEKNRIPLACRVLLLSSEKHSILIDVGCGRKWSEKELDIYAIEHLQEKPLYESLPKMSDIILTHLHFDHGAGLTHQVTDKTVELSFPEAVLHINKQHLEHARNPGVREKASYLATHIEPLRVSKLNLTENGQQIFDGIRVHQVDGHTHGLQWVEVRGGGRTLTFPSDLIPTAHHLPLPYVMGYDLNAEKAMEEKKAFLTRAVQEKWILVFEHDIETAAATVKLDEKGRYAVDEVVEIPEYQPR